MARATPVCGRGDSANLLNWEAFENDLAGISAGGETEPLTCIGADITEPIGPMDLSRFSLVPLITAERPDL